jgi:hypothetical protein
MNKIIPMLLCAGALSTMPMMAEDQPAFPGAEGFGRYVSGGRGGDVYHVTTLEDGNQEGTLRWAINKSGRRTIVFDVSGTIQLKSALSIVNGNITIAGQSAPGDGICVAGYPVTVSANNVILRFMRFRLGNEHVADHEGDGLGGLDRANVIVDHCSISWSIDECCSFCGMENSTVQWCIVSQSLRNAGHVKGNHGYGGNWGGSGMSYHHNLVCHHESRTPRLGPRYTTQLDERMDMRNNVIYNWAGNGCYGGEAQNVNIVNNYYKPGPATRAKGGKIAYRIAGIGIRTNSYIKTYPVYEPTLHIWGKFFIDGNTIDGNAEVTADNWTKGVYEQISNSDNDNTFTQETRDTMRLAEPIHFYPTTTHTADVAYDKVLNYAGASLSRDALDEVMVSDVRNNIATYSGKSAGNGIIDTQEDCLAEGASSPWPELKSTTAPTDTDGDGMPDQWETAHGLNPNDADDRNKVDEVSGYTMLEIYLNSLVEDIMTQCSADGTLEGIALDSANEETGSATLSATTYTGTTNGGGVSKWEFGDEWSVSNGSGKGYASGTNNRVKYSRDVDFTISVPEGKKITEMTFSGYSNSDSGTAYLSNLGDEEFGEDLYVFPSRKEGVNVDYTITPSQPLSGDVLMRYAGNQVGMIITITYSNPASGIESVSINTDANRIVNVYNLKGQCVKANIAYGEISNALGKGIYVVDGQKVIIK